MTDTCFIIMPISMPKGRVADYKDGDGHFRFVLTHLFEPAVKAAGMKPVIPSAVGSEMIHSRIIEQLEKADLVLCDMSCWNPNVFFELGVRTALDQAVCMVKDDKTESPPFDVAGMNYHTYNSELFPWVLEAEIPKLTKHIKESVGERNEMWRVFGISSRAAPHDARPMEDDTQNLLLLEIGDLKRKVERLGPTDHRGGRSPRFSPEWVTGRFTAAERVLSAEPRDRGDGWAREAARVSAALALVREDNRCTHELRDRALGYQEDIFVAMGERSGEPDGSDAAADE